MADTATFLKEKEQLIKRISDQLNSWDLTVEHALEILDANREIFQQLMVVDQKVPDDALEEFNEKHEEQWTELLNTHQELIQKIQEEQEAVQNQLKQISNKEKVVSEYMALKNKSIFVEKNY